MRAMMNRSALMMMLWATAALAHDQVPGKPQERPVLLRGGDLYTVSQGVLPATDLLFDRGTIRKIGKGLAAPEGAEVLDVAGKRVYPGIIATATTLGLVEIGAVRATNDVREVGGVTPEVVAHTAYNWDSEVLPTVRSHGITTAQVMPQGGLVSGRSSITHLDGWTKEDAAVDLVDGVVLNWPASGVSTSPFVRTTPEEQRKEQAEARAELARFFRAARNYHLERIAVPSTPIDARLEAMRTVLTREIPLYVVADDERQITEALRFAAEQEIRVVLVGAREAERVQDLIKAAGVPVILGSNTNLPGRPDDDYDAVYRLPAALHAAGIRFCLASDGTATEQRNLPFMAGMAAAFGLPKEAALRAITLSAAEILGIADEQGSLEVGKAATLFISEGDVLDTLTQKVTHLWINGSAVDLDDRHKMLERKYRQRLGAKAAAL